ncbi:hypothetical protein GGX14DRAFT_562371 [Mycena pura]|uniref:Uncharacterized protein n=1 Tax=Mycena pura TaxID=153505 RepID=A0AAD6VTW9_9AGAR|nr:hypothetical protein GGX14DRAFT_562371 [Mycena pura]
MLAAEPEALRQHIMALLLSYARRSGCVSRVLILIRPVDVAAAVRLRARAAALLLGVAAPGRPGWHGHGGWRRDHGAGSSPSSSSPPRSPTIQTSSRRPGPSGTHTGAILDTPSAANRPGSWMRTDRTHTHTRTPAPRLNGARPAAHFGHFPLPATRLSARRPLSLTAQDRLHTLATTRAQGKRHPVRAHRRLNRHRMPGPFQYARLEDRVRKSP